MQMWNNRIQLKSMRLLNPNNFHCLDCHSCADKCYKQGYFNIVYTETSKQTQM